MAPRVSQCRCHKDGQWFVPGGRIPSTHILKPQLEDFEEHALNEHFCLQLAASIGLLRAESRILEIAGRKVLCVKRYDRVENPPGTITRWHQEDTCQALGFYPGQKYQAVIASLEPNRDAIAETNDSPFLHKLADAIAGRARKCAVVMGLG